MSERFNPVEVTSFKISTGAESNRPVTEDDCGQTWNC